MQKPGIREEYSNGVPVQQLVIINKFTTCCNTGSTRDDPYWTSLKNSLELIELSTINKVSLVSVFSCSNTGSIR